MTTNNLPHNDLYPRLSRFLSINTLLYVALILALVASLQHVAFAFASTNGGNWLEAYISAVAIDLGLLALAAGIAKRVKARRPTWPLWLGVALFSAISIYANWLSGMVHLTPIEANGWGQHLVNLRPILLSAVLPILVIYLSEIVSTDHTAARAVAEKEAKRSTKRLGSPANGSFIPGDPDALKLANDTREAKQQARREQLMMLHRATDMTRAQLAETLGVSESTIKRDMKALNLNGRH